MNEDIPVAEQVSELWEQNVQPKMTHNSQYGGVIFCRGCPVTKSTVMCDHGWLGMRRVCNRQAAG